jgi:GntR family transcriptional repressor for pyruvate dehydrogenase complex
MEWQKVEPVHATRVYTEIVRQIRTLVAEGRLKSGDRLPPERELAERFNVSRASVREALRALESMRLIQIRVGEGTFVREIAVDSLVEPLALAILTRREATGELFEARRLLEPPIAALAAIRATAEERREMERIVAHQGSEVERGHTGLAEDAAFHAAIAASAHNHAITRIVHALVDLLKKSREQSLRTPGRAQRSHEDHKAILAAIRERNPEAAREAMLAHVVAVEALVRRGYASRPAEARPPRKSKRG